LGLGYTCYSNPVFFGEREHWDYKVTFSFVEGVGHGEVVFESVSNKIFNKERKTIEIELELKSEAQNKVYEVFLNGCL